MWCGYCLVVADGKEKFGCLGLSLAGSVVVRIDAAPDAYCE